LYQFNDATYNTVSTSGKMFESYVLPTQYSDFGFGPLASYSSHGCSSQTSIVFSNLNMLEDNSISFTDLVKGFTWNYPGSFRVVANVDNDGYLITAMFRI
jgi:hypothetical protein